MVRQVQVTVPEDKVGVVEGFLRPLEDVHQLAVFPGQGSVLLIFRARPKKLQAIVEGLDRLGCGRAWGSVDIVALQMTKPRLESSHPNKPKPRQYRIDDRMTIEEIYEAVDSQLHLTFDYIALTLVAATIASAGLLSNSPVIVAASMLVSPLMGPVLGQTLGILLGDDLFRWKGFRNELVGAAITFGVGALSALLMALFEFPDTDEMRARGRPISLLWGVLVAAASGVGLALSVANGGVNALVGVAISASLLPPVVNSGITLTLGCVTLVLHQEERSGRYLGYAFYSLWLFLINWVLIVLFGILTLKLKNIRQSSVHRKHDFEQLQSSTTVETMVEM